MTLLKEGDSINFQKASCTLDGCVKIYTSRVDNVDSETKRLLNGLVDNVGGEKNAFKHFKFLTDLLYTIAGDMDNDDEGGDAAMKKAKKVFVQEEIYFCPQLTFLPICLYCPPQDSHCRQNPGKGYF